MSEIWKQLSLPLVRVIENPAVIRSFFSDSKLYPKGKYVMLAGLMIMTYPIKSQQSCNGEEQWQGLFETRDNPKWHV